MPRPPSRPFQNKTGISHGGLTEGLRGGELATWIQESLAAEGIERDRLPQQVGDSGH